MDADDFGLDVFEQTILEGFYLCVNVQQGGLSTTKSLDSLVLKEFCKMQKMDFIWVYGVCKLMLSGLEDYRK